MKADDYDAFLLDPSDFTIRKFLPRAFSELEGLAALPPPSIMLLGYSALKQLRTLSNPQVAASLQALAKAAQQVAEKSQMEAAFARKMEEAGFPMSVSASSFATAPFDYMSDTLRGMRGIMMDMYRRKDKLLAAMDRVIPVVVEVAATAARNGVPYCFIPLHRGSDGFMSVEQFETFYWPSLKAMLLGMIEGGATPSVFWEGTYNERLHYLRELPKAKIIGRFDRSDLFKVKEVIGDTMCIMGGFPVSLLQGGTVEQVREHTKKLCEVVGRDGGFIMGPNTYMSDCKLELVEAWVETTKKYGVY
jgi:uroporphyrinogen-III decarboxylase